MTSAVTLLGTCNKVYIFGNVRFQWMHGWQKDRAGCAGISNRKLTYLYLDTPPYQMEGKETESTEKSSTFIRSIPE
ncbi:hypothetical protein IscW_ISCW000498 [Ixodes scapularis]|uniref:Uncharacterized protein n=1 Tax=Ixodes scapularis TaxID=6945 RepID=B7P709_IXOSC|nr:hypothetical protein IscW_ISCW000498 [Ixodes scapularis]|eukprot:XP_002409434.1 hypothetical protein IscW_ISCW000498 [Ixodes scapularis]